VHSAGERPKDEFLRRALSAVADVLWILDFYRGQDMRRPRKQSQGDTQKPSPSPPCCSKEAP
jgi:hypothetical protein